MPAPTEPNSAVAPSEAPVALVTGAAHRVGAAIVRHLHATGYRVLIHYRRSAAPAQALAEELEGLRPGSARTLAAELLDTAALPGLVERARAAWGRLDALVNNASVFYPTPLGAIEERHWEELLGTNLKAPLFLAQAAAPELRRRRGAIVNIVDIHAERPLKGHPVYSVAKAGLAMLTRSLARELGPEVRVNGVAPGAILWPEQGLDEAQRREIVARTALKRRGEPADVARAVLFLLRDAPYVTGQILAVDGGRSLGQ